LEVLLLRGGKKSEKGEKM